MVVDTPCQLMYKSQGKSNGNDEHKVARGHYKCIIKTTKPTQKGE